jgi:hypothetical protein
MTTRDLLALLDRPCATRHPDGTLSHGTLTDAMTCADELRCTVRVEGLTDNGIFRVWEQTYPGSRVWLLIGSRSEGAGGRWTRADHLRERGAA